MTFIGLTSKSPTEVYSALFVTLFYRRLTHFSTASFAVTWAANLAATADVLQSLSPCTDVHTMPV